MYCTSPQADISGMTQMASPALPPLSPSARPTCPSSGPVSASIMLVGESPSDSEIRQQEPFVGPAGRVLNKALAAAGLNRAELRLVNLVPSQPPKNRFELHTAEDLAWGQALLSEEISLLPQLKLIVCLGGNPSRVIQGPREQGITKWRGSLFPPQDQLTGDPNNEYWTQYPTRPLVAIPSSVATLATFHPAAVLRQFPWHIWLVNDLQRARLWAEGDPWVRTHPRRFFFNQYAELPRLVEVAMAEGMVAVDTEMDPQICCLVTRDEVHSFVWRPEAWPHVNRVMTSPRVLKVAHNMAHDWRQMEVYWGIEVVPPYFDTIAGAHILEPSGFDPGGDGEVDAGEQMVGKSLSPHISTKFTPWPYHKWLAEHDPLLYCGIDTVVAYDAYWTQLAQLGLQPKLFEIAARDHRLWRILFSMQRRGVLVDEVARAEVQVELGSKLGGIDVQLEEVARPLVRRAHERGRLKTPHLFVEDKVCPCCRSAKKKSQACWQCLGFEAQPDKAQLMALAQAQGVDVPPKTSKLLLEKFLLKPCRLCGGTGEKIREWQQLNWDSPAQVADLLYRGLGIPPRQYQGRETINFAQLGQVLEPGGWLGPQALAASPERWEAFHLLSRYIQRAEVRAELDTVKRLQPGPDGRLRSVFDPWYTPTQRVASREGLFDVGTNLQNIPVEGRRFIVADPGQAFLYPDYRQIEARCVAVLSQDEAFISLFKGDQNSHKAVAQLILEKTGIELSYAQAKRLSFATLYGIEASHLSTILGISPLQAQLVLQAFFTHFRGIPRWHEAVREELRRSRSNTSPTGWVRRWLGYVLGERGKAKGMLKEKVVKEALATSPQNMAARVLAQGLIQLEEQAGWIASAAHVHDAALLTVELDRLGEAGLAAERAMTVRLWDMDFPVEVSFGPNWLVASLKDEEKEKRGWGEWTRRRVLGLVEAA